MSNKYDVIIGATAVGIFAALQLIRTTKALRGLLRPIVPLFFVSSRAHPKVLSKLVAFGVGLGIFYFGIKLCDLIDRVRPTHANDTEGTQQNANSDERVLNPNCVVCWEQPRTIVNIPCAHMCLCSQCSVKLQRAGVKRCPVCQGAVQRQMTVIVS
eukprot:Phypoly_transcript_19030.p1 GENE.Phypoly_transcript_19030~~Phypoly_transcript_19030.p1  ORF type:complete len:156 (+),score=1.75 Phypoly_transcript_19030:32-499(+)